MTLENIALEELKELSKGLDLSHFAARKQADIIEYTPKDGKGTIFAIGIIKESRVSVAKVFFSKGAIFDWHKHAQNETIICFSGGFRYKKHNCEDPYKLFMHGETLFTKAGTCHMFEALQDSWTIAITVPMSEDFPNVRR